MDPCRDLAALDGLPLGSYTLRLRDVVPLNWVEQAKFDLYLEDTASRSSLTPVFSGLYSAGRPSAYIAGWIDGVYYDEVRFPPGTGSETLDLTAAELDGSLMASLGRLIPAGGRMWLAYEVFAGEGKVHRATRRALALGIPLIATPAGYLLYQAGCWCGLRDWYIPEGWREGPRKLQGNKPVDDAHARRRAIETVAVLRAFLTCPPGGEPDIVSAARARAEQVVEGLRLWAS